MSNSRRQLEQGQTYYFCTCGRSANQPFCDGAHTALST
ncbi:MAG: CDGSH iron-sulfur domain-containing protein [Gammaproteobacteria bacterium]|nr:CDGSH iron-sulfur domain-containing protein [Gammaproteobacteria bacterium]